jgi:hypothetical protein
MAIECFKILNKLSPPCLHDLVVFKDCKYNFRYSNMKKFTTYDDDGRQAMAIAHITLWVR